MKEEKLFLFTFFIVLLLWVLLLVLHDIKKPSSPVEETYHRQLVTVIDSILDAKLYIEPIDSDDVTVPHDQFGRVILPLDYK